ncbi:hypothetical protein DYH10_00030 [Candidatus Saccharibacteria bacterium CPR2]|nr:hypothetical protein [Candidatus Saccharibacteria bacterium CPR2]
MRVIDFKKDATYKAKPSPEIIDVPKMLFVMVDGEGAPETTGKGETEFQQAMQALFGVVYTIKFWDKKHSTPPGYAKFTMAPLEGLWWTKSGKMFDSKNPDDWKWTVMIRLPEFVTPKYFKEVVDELIAKKQSQVYKKARLQEFTEGTCVQIMHIGPYDQEQPNIERMHAYAKEQGYEAVGKHHELYFGDPRRTAPEKLRTILRHPVKK